MIGSSCPLRVLLPAVALVAVLAAAAEPAAPSPEASATEPQFHPLHLADGQDTANDRCPVRKRPLNPKLEPLWVNGKPIGFC